MPWFELGDKVAGRYLTREVTGTVIDIKFDREPHARTYTVKLDKPVNVSTSEHMIFERRRLVVHLDETGRSLDTKNRPDNIAHLAKAV
jgi:hypothetical protein